MRNLELREGIMDGMPELIVVTGPPGDGKTTVARFLSKLFELMFPGLAMH